MFSVEDASIMHSLTFANSRFMILTYNKAMLIVIDMLEKISY